MKIDYWVQDEENNREFLIEFSADIENDGIGAYEFWGQKCVDRGTNYIGDITFNETDLTDEEIALAEALVEERDVLESAFNDSYGVDKRY